MGDIVLQFGADAPVNTAALSGNDPSGISGLSETEQNKVREFVKQIDITDDVAMIAYGAAAQQKMADFSESFLRGVKTKDAGEAGRLLSNLVLEIQGFETDSAGKKGFFGLGNIKKSFAKMISAYSKVEVNVDKISDLLEEHRRRLLTDIALYDSMFENNHNYFKEISMYIIAGKEKLREIEEIIIPELRADAENNPDGAAAQRLSDMLAAQNQFEKKIHDLQLSRTISLQTAPQIRLVQNNDSQLADKIQSTLVNSIPLWKNQIAISLGLEHSRRALKTQKMVTDMTNSLLRKNSELLKEGSVEIARESERGIADLETLQKTNRDLIDTINAVLDIQAKGSEARRLAETELVKIETELKQTLIQAKRNV